MTIWWKNKPPLKLLCFWFREAIYWSIIPVPWNSSAYLEARDAYIQEFLKWLAEIDKDNGIRTQ